MTGLFGTGYGSAELGWIPAFPAGKFCPKCAAGWAFLAVSAGIVAYLFVREYKKEK
jgi:hypothetical protein